VERVIGAPTVEPDPAVAASPCLLGAGFEHRRAVALAVLSRSVSKTPARRLASQRFALLPARFRSWSSRSKLLIDRRRGSIAPHATFDAERAGHLH
jgi:hypothetical protein